MVKDTKIEEPSFRYIVRVANTDLDGKKSLRLALLKIKGVGFAYSNMACTLAAVDRNARVGDLTEDEVSRIDQVVRNPASYGAPSWLFNRRRDPETGEDLHALGPELALDKDTDVKNLKMTRSFRGLRHQWGLPLRGQRTRSNFRPNKGKGSLGVKRRKGSKAGRV